MPNGDARHGDSFCASHNSTPGEVTDGTVAAQDRELEQKYRRIIDEASDAIYIADKDGRFLEANPSTTTLLGYSLDELRSLTVFDIIPESHRTSSLVVGALGVGEKKVMERTYRRKDGTLVAVENSVSFTPWQTYQVIARDVTERKQTETELHTAREMIQQVQKLEAIGQLAGGVAHDFNNILMTICSYGDLLRDCIPTQAKGSAYVDGIIRAVERGASLTQQLLAFSRKQTLVPRVLDLNQVIRESLKMIGRLIGEHIELNFIPEETLPFVNADPAQIDQILLNLAVNARDAMPSGGLLKIETRRVKCVPSRAVPADQIAPSGDYAVITVSDTGTGMTDEVKSRLFEPFFTTKKDGSGTGLGLASVYGVVKQSGGFLNVDSVVGQGTSFDIYLPALSAVAKSESRRLSAEKNQPSPRATILVVEDTADLRRSMCEFLQAYGFNVIEAESPAKARELAKACSEIDVLLTDVVMPKMRGDELSRLLEADRPQLKTLFMSGYTDGAILGEALAENNAVFLRKPFSLRELVRKISEVIAEPAKTMP